MLTSSPNIGAVWRERRVAIIAMAVLYGALFWEVYRQWALDCWELEDFSHCLLVPVISLVIVYSNRARLADSPVRGWGAGALLLGVSLSTFGFGLATSLNVFMRAGAFGTLVGLGALVFGTTGLRRALFPAGYLLLAIPIPFVYYTKISLQLRGMVTAMSAKILQLVDVPALNDGNVLAIGEIRLGVVDACSGIRSVMAIFSVAILLAYLKRARVVSGALLVLFTLPIAILLNTGRVLAVAYARYSFDVDLTSGSLHEALGLVVFAAILAAMYASWLFVSWLTMEAKHSDPLDESGCRDDVVEAGAET